jgi:TonB family protein
MKKILRPVVLFALAALAVSRLCASIESIKIDPTFVPRIRPTLLMSGITEGKVALVIAVSAEGRLTDWLVLGYTDRLMVDTCLEALKEWTITPARVDGQPVPAQVELTIDVTAEGVVVSRSGPQDPDQIVRRITGNPIKYQTSSAPQLDRTLVRINTVAPKYALAAARQGVHGKVQVHFYIDEQGGVRMPAVDADAHPYLSDIAVAAIREWRFEPPTRHGRPVLIAASQEFDFNGN